MKSPNLVDIPNQATDRRRPTATDYAEFRDLTVSSTLGGGAKRTHPQPGALLRGPSNRLSDYPRLDRDNALSEDALIRAHGMRPEDLRR
jgi:hypothetical protein